MKRMSGRLLGVQSGSRVETAMQLATKLQLATDELGRGQYAAESLKFPGSM